MKRPPLMRTQVVIEPALSVDAEAMAAIHAQAFDRSWSATELEALLTDRHIVAMVARRGDARANTLYKMHKMHKSHKLHKMNRMIVGFVVAHVGADAAEILSLATTERYRRRGHARALMVSLAAQLNRRGVRRLVLEVDENNLSAISLYEGLSFQRVGERKNYNRQADLAPATALIMARDLDINV